MATDSNLVSLASATALDSDDLLYSEEDGAPVKVTYAVLRTFLASLGWAAADVDITDSGNLYAATDVEAALAEIATRVESVGLAGFHFVFDDGTGATDPGPGVIRFNNATQPSATAVYIDDVTSDGVDLSTLFGSLGSSGLLKISNVIDNTEWRVVKWTAAPTDNTGWWTFTTVDQAGLGTFEDGDEVHVVPLQLAAGSAPVTSVNGLTGAVTTVPLTASPSFSATPTIDTSDKDVIYFGALTANVTAFNLSGTRAKVIVCFVQDGTGGRTVTAGSSIDFGTEITSLSGINSTASSYTYVGFVYNQTTTKFRVVAISK